MKFLYRFDLVHLDEVLTTLSHPSSWSGSSVASHAATEAIFITSWDSPIKLPAGALTSSLLPSTGSESAEQVYAPEAISHEELRYDSESAAGELSVSLPIAHRISRLLAQDTEGQRVWLTLAYLDILGTPRTLWTGAISSAEYDEYRCRLTGTPLLQLMRRQAQTALHPRSCGHNLFDPKTCRVRSAAIDPATRYFAYREDGWLLASAITEGGTRVRIPELANRPAGWAAQGYVVLEGIYSSTGGRSTHVPRASTQQSASYGSAVSGGVRRLVTAHDGDMLELAAPLPLSYASNAQDVYYRASVFAGCDGARSTCVEKFNNLRFFGGYPYIPLQSPFTEDTKPQPGTIFHKDRR